MKIDHIAIAVSDVEESAKIYQQALGVDVALFLVVRRLKRGIGEGFVTRLAAIALDSLTIRYPLK